MRVGSKYWLVVAVIVVAVQSGAGAEDDPAGAAEARQAALAKRLAEATAAIEAEPRNPHRFAARAALEIAAGQYPSAIDDYDRLLELAPDTATAYDERGSAKFMAGRIEASIEDFDRYLKLRPDQQPWHWKRGISYYYAGRYDAGRKQFEGYQTVDDNDVENAVWRFLCMARSVGVEQARKDLLRIKRDLRIPMTEVYRLFAGKVTSDDVLAAARAGDPNPAELNARLFYAHLYLGLYFEATGAAALARQHITTAAEKHRIGHYMWNVADVHARRLAADAKKPSPPGR
jgi:lipoprotein NlpI